MADLDPTVVNLAKAIRQQESGGDFTIKGKSGEYGGYQFTPDTWNGTAPKYGIKVPLQQATPEQQNAVAYNQIKVWKDEGKDVTQIASMWNAGQGEPDAYTGKFSTGKPSTGTNSFGVKYDVPSYVKAVANNYLTYKNQGTTPNDLSTPTSTPIAPTTDNTQPTPDQNPGFFSRVGTDINNIGKKLAGDIGNTSIMGGNGTQNIGTTVAEGATAPLEGAGSIINEGINSLGSVTGLKKPYESFINFLADKVTNVPGVSDALNTVHDYLDKHPEISTNLNSAMTAATFAGGEGPVKEGLSDAGTLIKDTTADAVKPIRTALENKYINNTVEDWNRIGGDYVKSSKLLDQEGTSGKDTPNFLAQMGINPKELIEDNKFKTSEVANKLTTEAVKPYEEILTQQLKVAQQGQPFVDIGEIHSNIVKKINSIENLTAGDRESMINDATSEMRALNRRYPKGIPLDKLNIEKGNYWRNTKFDLTRPLKPQVNYNIGSAMKQMIEEKVPDASIKELNGLLGDYYAAGKFLRGINDRVPKLTAGQKIVRGVVKGAAVVGGEKMFGFQGGVAGFLLSKSIAHLLENASNPLKSWILDNLEKTNPKVFDQAVQWLGQQEKNRLSRLMLPEGDSSKVAIPMGAKTTPAANTFMNDFEQNTNIAKNTKRLPAPSPRTIVPNTGGIPNISPDAGIGGMRQKLPPTNL